MGVGHYFEIQKNRIMTVKGKGIVIFQGMQDHTAESVKSLEGFDVAWVEEAQSMSNRSLELLDPTIRKEGSELWFSWNPNLDTDPVEQIFKNNDNAVLVHVNYLDNPFVTDATKEMAERTRANNVLKYNHIWLGDYMKEIEGALWNGDMLQASRVNKDEIPDLTRIVVAIDPSVTGNAKSDETGIVVAGRTANDDTYYVLEDCSLRGTPVSYTHLTLPTKRIV